MHARTVSRWHRTLFIALLGGCMSCSSPPVSQPNELAEKFLDAFYSWDPQRITAIVEPGDDADRVLYYQGWAQAANYQVQTRRPCKTLNDNDAECAVTVTDDFGKALGYTATDTFTITVAGDRISAVSFEGDDPPVFQAVFAWIAEQRPEILTGPCEDMFDGGTTPDECAKAVAQAARDYVASQGR